MPSSRTSSLKVRLATTTVTCARVAYECLPTVVSASATTRYTLASTSGGSRVAVTSISTGRPSRETRLSPPARRPSLVRADWRIPRGQLAELGVALLGVIDRSGEQRLHALPVLAQLQGDDRTDQALLRSVVEVAYDPPARVVACGEHAGAGCHELIAAVGVRDCCVDQCGELGEALLGVEARQVLARPLAVTPHSAPSTTMGAPTVMLTPER
jgi:hypothetical protein